MQYKLLGTLSAAAWFGVFATTASAQFSFNYQVAPPGLPRGFSVQASGAGAASAFGYRTSYNYTLRAGPVFYSQSGNSFTSFRNPLGGFTTQTITSNVPVWYGNGGAGGYYYGASQGYNYNSYISNGSYTQGGFGANLPLTPVGREYDRQRQNVFDEWTAERDRGPQAEDRQQQAARVAFERSLNEPSEADVVSGAALNAVVSALDGQRAKLKDAPQVLVPEDALRQAVFSKGGTSLNAGLLADGGLTWPRALVRLTETAETRQKIETGFAAAHRQLAAGKPVDAREAKALEEAARQLESAIGMNVSKLGFDDHRDAKRFLKSLEDSIAFLKLPDAGQWLPGKADIQAKTAAELVKALTEKGAKFAPAKPGTEKAYYALHQALADAYRQAVAPQVAAEVK